MPIPQEILAIERPKNTVVKKSGNRYLVIKRTCKRKNGKPYPVALGTIGEIIDSKYVQIQEEPRKKLRDSIDIKDYGEVTLCNDAAGDLLQELANVFDIKTAKTLYTIALYKTILDLDTVNVQGDYRLIATEFINFLSVIITTRVRNVLLEKDVVFDVKKKWRSSYEENC